MLWYLLIFIPWVLTVLALLIIMMNNNSSSEEYEEDDFMFDEDREVVRVAVYDEKAYWVYDNVFYVSEVTREPDFNTATPIDTTSMTAKELNELMAILDELKNSEGD